VTLKMKEQKEQKDPDICRADVFLSLLKSGLTKMDIERNIHLNELTQYDLTGDKACFL
jgi:hypothetical protein